MTEADIRLQQERLKLANLKGKLHRLAQLTPAGDIPQEQYEDAALAVEVQALEVQLWELRAKPTRTPDMETGG